MGTYGNSAGSTAISRGRHEKTIISAPREVRGVVIQELPESGGVSH